MSKIKLGIIGFGNMGRSHAKNIKEGKCPEVEFVAVADYKEENATWLKENGYENVTYFDDAEKMMDSGLIDSVLIASPHYDHPKYSMMAMDKGLHVMCEKPAGVYTKQVREMNEHAEGKGRRRGFCRRGPGCADGTERPDPGAVRREGQRDRGRAKSGQTGNRHADDQGGR